MRASLVGMMTSLIADKLQIDSLQYPGEKRTWYMAPPVYVRASSQVLPQTAIWPIAADQMKVNTRMNVDKLN